MIAGEGRGGDLPALPPDPPPNPLKVLVAQASSLCKKRSGVGGGSLREEAGVRDPWPPPSIFFRSVNSDGEIHFDFEDMLGGQAQHFDARGPGDLAQDCSESRRGLRNEGEPDVIVMAS